MKVYNLKLTNRFFFQSSGIPSVNREDCRVRDTEINKGEIITYLSLKLSFDHIRSFKVKGQRFLVATMIQVDQMLSFILQHN